MNLKRQAGAELVEFALILPMFFGLIFTIFQFGWLLCNYAVLTTAASTGARVMAVQRGYSAPYTDTRNAVLAAVGFLPKSSLGISVTVNGASCQSDSVCITALGTTNSPPAAGAQARVSLTYPFTPIFGRWFGMGPLTLSATMSELVQ